MYITTKYILIEEIVLQILKKIPPSAPHNHTVFI